MELPAPYGWYIYPTLWTYVTDVAVLSVVGLWVIISGFATSKDAVVRIFVQVIFIYFPFWIAKILNIFKRFIYHFYFT